MYAIWFDKYVHMLEADDTTRMTKVRLIGQLESGFYPFITCNIFVDVIITNKLHSLGIIS
jgi:hypothetical protein